MNPTSRNVVAVAGVTASGKSDLANTLAGWFDGELVCADSRTVHRELDIGTAKPTNADRGNIPHHLIDIVDAGGLIDAQEFSELAVDAINNITSRQRLPIVVGGTQLFMTVALHHTTHTPHTNIEVFATLPLQEVHKRFRSANVALPLNWHDRTVLTRAWQQNQISTIGAARQPTLLLATTTPANLEDRVRQRLHNMIDRGLREEVIELCERHQRTISSWYSIGYHEWSHWYDGTMGLDDTITTIVHNTMVYAQRQQQWLSNIGGAVIVDSQEHATNVVGEFLHHQTHQPAT